LSVHPSAEFSYCLHRGDGGLSAAIVSADHGGMIMTNKSLILGVVTLCALPAASQAQVLLSENFNELATTAPMVVVGPAAVGPDFTGIRFQITGACTAPASGHCLILNGGATANSLTSKMITLQPGNYSLSFDALGNINAAAGTTNVLEVALGSFTHDITLTNNRPPGSAAYSHTITVPSTETVDLMFKGVGTIGANGPIIDNIRLAGVPEPATLGLMAFGLLGAGLFAGRKRRN
jgi:hypothetical protein